MKRTYISSKCLAISVILLLSLLALSPSSLAQDEQIEENTGGKMAFITKDDILPQIEPNQWTSLEFTAYDQYDFNWTEFSDPETGFPEWYMKVVWPFMFGNLEIARYLGYTTVELYADVVDQYGNIADGWSAQASPSTISQTTQGMKHNVCFNVQTNEYSVDYSVQLRVKVTRKDSWGDVEGYNYFYIPLKAASLNYVELVSTKPTMKASPMSIAEFELQVTNKGYYADIFRFDILTESDLVGIVETQGLALEPGETRNIKLQVMTPESFYDPGTSNNLDIYTWSRLNQTAVYIGSVNVITEGIYISPLIIFVLGIILLALVCIASFYYFFIRSSEDKNKKDTKDEKETKKESKGFFSGIFKEETEEKQKTEKKLKIKKKK